MSYRTQYQDSRSCRIDKFLAQQTEYSRQEVKDMIDTSLVFCNKQQVRKPSYQISQGDEVEIDIARWKRKEGGQYSPPDINYISIIVEREDFLVIHKPSGLLVHKTNNPESVSLVEYLVAKYPEIQGIQDDMSKRHDGNWQPRHGIVHRLDKDTSGIMLIARTWEGFYGLKHLFQERLVHKTYYALVRGRVKSDHGHITYPIARSRMDHTKRRVITDPQELAQTQRHAHSEYWREQSFSDSTLVKVKLHTGRTHQIRLHLKALGHPVIGDTQYGGKLERQTPHRQMLHAYSLDFRYQDHDYSFSCPFPQDLQEIIAEKKKNPQLS